MKSKKPDPEDTPPNNRELKSHQIFDAFFKDHSLKALYATLRLHPNTLGTWRKPENSGDSQLRFNPLDRIVQLCTTTGDLRLIEWLCAQFGGFLVSHPSSQRVQQSLHQASAKVTQRFAGMIECIAVAVSDETVDDKEAAQIRGQWERLKSLVEGFVDGCERREFARVGQAFRQLDDTKIAGAQSGSPKRGRGLKRSVKKF